MLKNYSAFLIFSLSASTGTVPCLLFARDASVNGDSKWSTSSERLAPRGTLSGEKLHTKLLSVIAGAQERRNFSDTFGKAGLSQSNVLNFIKRIVVDAVFRQGAAVKKTFSMNSEHLWLRGAGYVRGDDLSLGLNQLPAEELLWRRIIICLVDLMLGLAFEEEKQRAIDLMRVSTGNEVQIVPSSKKVPELPEGFVSDVVSRIIAMWPGKEKREVPFSYGIQMKLYDDPTGQQRKIAKIVAMLFVAMALGDDEFVLTAAKTLRRELYIDSSYDLGLAFGAMEPNRISRREPSEDEMTILRGAAEIMEAVMEMASSTVVSPFIKRRFNFRRQGSGFGALESEK